MVDMSPRLSYSYIKTLIKSHLDKRFPSDTCVDHSMATYNQLTRISNVRMNILPFSKTTGVHGRVLGGGRLGSDIRVRAEDGFCRDKIAFPTTKVEGVEGESTLVFLGANGQEVEVQAAKVLYLFF